MSPKILYNFTKHLFFGTALTTASLATSKSSTKNKVHKAMFVENNNSTNFELNVKHVIKKAYVDVGFKGNVYVEFDDSVRTIRAYNFFDAQHKTATHVKINPELIHRLTDDEIYAVGGHEAVHSLYKHTAIKRATVYFYLIETCIFINLFENPKLYALAFLGSVPFNIFISRKLERNADTLSCKKLGTALPLISMLEKTKQDKPKKLIDYIKRSLDSQGPNEARIAHIKKCCDLSDTPHLQP